MLSWPHTSIFPKTTLHSIYFYCLFYWLLPQPKSKCQEGKDSVSSLLWHLQDRHLAPSGDLTTIFDQINGHVPSHTVLQMSDHFFLVTTQDKSTNLNRNPLEMNLCLSRFPVRDCFSSENSPAPDMVLTHGHGSPTSMGSGLCKKASMPPGQQFPLPWSVIVPQGHFAHHRHKYWTWQHQNFGRPLTLMRR